jgi:hypothetical protein
VPAQDGNTQRICQQCGDHGCGGYDDWMARMLDSPDPLRFCSRTCARDFARGKTTQQTRRELVQSMLENGGWTRQELIADGYEDWLL